MRTIGTRSRRSGNDERIDEMLSEPVIQGCSELYRIRILYDMCFIAITFDGYLWRLTVNIKELSETDLKQKIENIKAEREKTADALKRYEEELERRKQEVSLGVPSLVRVNYDNKYYTVSINNDVRETLDLLSSFDDERFNCLNYFHSKESAQKHAEMLLAWCKALVANAKGEPIDISILRPLLKKGYAAMDEDERWFWYEREPIKIGSVWLCVYCVCLSTTFNLKPAEDWKSSLMKCGL